MMDRIQNLARTPSLGRSESQSSSEVPIEGAFSSGVLPSSDSTLSIFYCFMTCDFSLPNSSRFFTLFSLTFLVNLLLLALLGWAILSTVLGVFII